MIEIWKDIKDFEGIYQVSTFGRIKRLSRKTINEGLLGKNKELQLKEIILKPSTITKG